MPSRKKQPIQPILCEESSNSLKENSVKMAQCHRESTLIPAQLYLGGQPKFSGVNKPCLVEANDACGSEIASVVKP